MSVRAVAGVLAALLLLVIISVETAVSLQSTITCLFPFPFISFLSSCFYSSQNLLRILVSNSRVHNPNTFSSI